MGAIICLMSHDIAYVTAVTAPEYKSGFEPTKDTPYLDPTGELWSVFCEDFEENWLCYNSATLYNEMDAYTMLVNSNIFI